MAYDDAKGAEFLFQTYVEPTLHALINSKMSDSFEAVVEEPKAVQDSLSNETTLSDDDVEPVEDTPPSEEPETVESETKIPRSRKSVKVID